MRFAILLLCLAARLASAQEALTALDALKLLPKDVAKKLARIEARDSTPWPQRWYFLVFDAAEPRGLREFVVADGKLAASRTLSQFADELKPAEVVGSSAIHINSDEAVGIAAQFAMANHTRLGTVNYELCKTNTTPIWRLTCLNPDGDEIGVLALHATKGTVLSHEGFEIIPEGRIAAPPIVAAPRATTPRPVAKPPTPAPTPTPKPKPGPIDVGHSLRKFFGGAQ